MPLPAMSGAEHRRVGARSVDVAARRQADAAGDRAREVGDDVAEQVVGDDHVEALRVGGQVDHDRVDVAVVGGDVGVLLRHLLEEPPPHGAGVDQHVGLVDEGELLARALLRAGEGVADDPLDAEGGVDRHLGGDLGRGADAQRAAVAGVRALGALADDHEVDVTLAQHRVGERRGRARVEARGAEVDVVVELEAQLEQQAPLEDARRQVRVVRLAADGAEQDRVLAADLLQHAVREHLTGGEVALGTQVVLRPGELQLRGGGDLEDLEGLGGDLRTDAVTGDDGEVDLSGRGRGGGAVGHVGKT